MVNHHCQRTRRLAQEPPATCTTLFFFKIPHHSSPIVYIIHVSFLFFSFLVLPFVFTCYTTTSTKLSTRARGASLLQKEKAKQKQKRRFACLLAVSVRDTCVGTGEEPRRSSVMVIFAYAHHFHGTKGSNLLLFVIFCSPDLGSDPMKVEEEGELLAYYHSDDDSSVCTPTVFLLSVAGLLLCSLFTAASVGTLLRRARRTGRHGEGGMNRSPPPPPMRISSATIDGVSA